MHRIACVLALGLVACARSSSDGGEQGKVRLVVETLSSAKGQADLDLLVRDGAWDVGGLVRMLDAASVLAAEGAPLESVLAQGTSELETVTTDQLRGSVRSLQKRLGDGTCRISPAPPAVTDKARARIAAVKVPDGLSPALRARIDALRERALRMQTFYEATCGGPEPLIFGWLDGKVVPLARLFDPPELK